MSQEASYDDLGETDQGHDAVFNLCMIDRRRKVRLNIQLFDADGDEVSIREALKEITQYVKDKISTEETNDVAAKILPMMAESTACALPRLVGGDLAASLIAQEVVRYPLIQMMTIGFLLLKFIQKNGLKITTTEEQLSDEQIAHYERMNRASNAAVLTATLGGDPKAMLRELLKRGEITKEDVEGILGTESLETPEPAKGAKTN